MNRKFNWRKVRRILYWAMCGTLAVMVAYCGYLFWWMFGWSGVWEVLWRTGVKLAITGTLGGIILGIWWLVRLARKTIRAAR